MNSDITSILFCGVGGQGVLLASDIMSSVAIEAGLDVKKSEVHGMAQRGGNVDSHVRFGTKVHSPIIPKGEVDYLVGMEMVEPLRWAHMLNDRSVIVVNDQKIHSLFTATGIAQYPDNAWEALKAAYPGTILFDATGLARDMGNPKGVNIILMGLLAKQMHFEKDLWVTVLRKSLKPKIVDINLQAFERAWNLF